MAETEKTAERETLGDMFARLHHEFGRQARAVGEGGRHQARAAKFKRYAEAARNGTMPHNPCDSDLMAYNRETARALAAGRLTHVDDLPDDDDE